MPAGRQATGFHLHALDGGIDVSHRAASHRLLAKHVPRLHCGAELDLHAGALDDPDQGELEFARGLEPAGIERVPSLLKVGEHAEEILPDEMRQHETVVQFRAPTNRAAVLRLAPEPGHQCADQQLLGEAHARVGWHLERAELDQPEPAGDAVGRIELVDADFRAMGVPGDVDQQVAEGDLKQGRWHELAAVQDLGTAGYILVAPGVRGAVDVPANVRFENGRTEIDRTLGSSGRAFITGNVLNEARGNGTPLTTNGTRLWRYLAGDDWSAGTRTNGRARLYGSDEAYRQSFSSIGAGRAREMLTRIQKVGTQELGASADASFHLTHLAFVAGADVRDIRASDLERPTTGAAQQTSSRQRFVGGFGEAIAERGGWSGSASLRLDSAIDLDTRQFLGANRTAIPDRSEVVPSPRVGIVRQVGAHLAVHGSGFRAFRTPTMNELYRTGQVGQETTLPNARLVSERATGAEGGLSVRAGRFAGEAAYFWTEINRPVAAVLVSSTATTITNMRQNLGQFQSQGIETRLACNEGRAVSAVVGYQFAHAVVTSFPAQTTLVGKWIPDVARESVTAQLRLRSARLGELTVAARNSGRAFDDSANTYVLHSFFELDAYGERTLGRGFTAFVAAQNLLDRRADVARTPVLTQGIPVVVQGGVRFSWGARSR